MSPIATKFYGRELQETYTQRMIKKIDSIGGRFLYSLRMGIVEPVFGQLRHGLGLDHFTLRGQSKVDTQWKLYGMVHNLWKIYRYGWLRGGVS